MTPDDGAVVGSVDVEHDPGGTWTSTALMFDGTEMWGTYPITVTGPGGSQNIADVLGFDASGRTGDSLRVGHRPVGLAHDGTSGWSLRNDPVALIRFDAAGAVQDSIHLQIPDAVFLDFDGSHFWTLGWHLRRLYEVDVDGTVLAMRDLPSHDPAGLPSGLAVEGTHVWYSEGLIGGGGWLVPHDAVLSTTTSSRPGGAAGRATGCC